MSQNKSWQERALELKPQSQLFIDGKFVDAASGKTFENFSPSDGHLICNVASGDIDQVLTSTNLSQAYGIEISLYREEGRFFARAK